MRERWAVRILIRVTLFLLWVIFHAAPSVLGTGSTIEVKPTEELARMCRGRQPTGIAPRLLAGPFGDAVVLLGQGMGDQVDR